MPDGDVETFHEDGQWHNRVEGRGGLLSSHDDKDDAVAAGRQAAEQREVEHIIKKLSGAIGEKKSYGHDPRNTPV